MKHAGVVLAATQGAAVGAVQYTSHTTRFAGFALCLVGCAFSALSNAADIPLYPTGPSADSSFVRFINGTDAALELTAAGSQAKVQLDVHSFPTRRSSDDRKSVV